MEKARMWKTSRIELEEEQEGVSAPDTTVPIAGGPVRPCRAPSEDGGALPDPQVPEKAVRRRFSAKYKLRILEEADRCTERGELGALLRREGLYSSHLSSWRRQREEGTLAGLAPKRRGRKPQSSEQVELERLRRENQRLRDQLERAEAIIEVQKKLSEILSTPPPLPESEESR